MKVIEHIECTVNPEFSYEMLPPPRGASINKILDIVARLEPFKPSWINVTSHASSLVYQENYGGNITKKIYKKRPGTISVCGVIQNKFGIDAVAHMLCQGFTIDETENALIELSYLGVENILALRGDNLNYDKEVGQNKSVHSYANELVAQINKMKMGKFLNDTEYFPLNFCVGVAGYPEKHIAAPNMATDIQYLKQKVDAGAEYIITQMFFDNNKYYEFVKKCRESGIQVPIIPGLKLIKSVKQLQLLPHTFNIDLPTSLVDEITASPEHAPEIGREWGKKQIYDLLEHDVKNIHFFLMNDVDNILEIISKV